MTAALLRRPQANRRRRLRCSRNTNHSTHHRSSTIRRIHRRRYRRIPNSRSGNTPTSSHRPVVTSRKITPRTITHWGPTHPRRPIRALPRAPTASGRLLLPSSRTRPTTSDRRALVPGRHSLRIDRALSLLLLTRRATHFLRNRIPTPAPCNDTSTPRATPTTETATPHCRLPWV